MFIYWDVYWYTLGNGLLFWNMIMLMTFPRFLLQCEGKVIVTFIFHQIQLRSAFLVDIKLYLHVYLFISIFNAQEALHMLNYRGSKSFLSGLKTRLNMYSFKVVLFDKWFQYPQFQFQYPSPLNHGRRKHTFSRVTETYLNSQSFHTQNGIRMNTFHSYYYTATFRIKSRIKFSNFLTS